MMALAVLACERGSGFSRVDVNVRITALTATIIRIPRRVTLVMAYGAQDSAATVLVTLHTDAGLTGYGQIPVDLPSLSAVSIRANILTYYAPVVTGQSPLDRTLLVMAMERARPGQPLALAAVELALWDLTGKALGVPVYQLLGGKVRDGIALMAMVNATDPDALFAEARTTLAATPYPVLKMKIGMGVASDITRYHAVREAAGERATIQVDGNIGYELTDALTAIEAMARMGGLGMIEQPVAKMRDLAVLARQFGVPVMADESLQVPVDMLGLIRHGAVRAAFLKIGKHGGLLRSMQIAHLAEIAGIVLSVAVYYDVLAAVAAHAAAAFPAVTWPSFVTRLTDSILVEPLVPDDHGLILRVPEGPGFGVTLDPEKVRRYTVER